MSTPRQRRLHCKRGRQLCAICRALRVDSALLGRAWKASATAQRARLAGGLAVPSAFEPCVSHLLISVLEQTLPATLEQFPDWLDHRWVPHGLGWRKIDSRRRGEGGRGLCEHLVGEIAEQSAKSPSASSFTMSLATRRAIRLRQWSNRGHRTAKSGAPPCSSRTCRRSIGRGTTDFTT